MKFFIEKIKNEENLENIRETAKHFVKNKKELRKAFELAGKYTSSILLESFINGREITVPVVANKAYSIVEIIPSHDLYDYECKYTKGMSEYICPADLSINLSESIKDLALKVHKILNCRHYSRVDFLLDKNNLKLPRTLSEYL